MEDYLDFVKLDHTGFGKFFQTGLKFVGYLKLCPAETLQVSSSLRGLNYMFQEEPVQTGLKVPESVLLFQEDFLE